MFFERPEYIPEKEWSEIASRYESTFAAWEMKFDWQREHQHFTLMLATWAAERASRSADRKHRHTDLLRFR
jgi:hypothetical protein